MISRAILLAASVLALPVCAGCNDTRSGDDPARSRTSSTGSTVPDAQNYPPGKVPNSIANGRDGAGVGSPEMPTNIPGQGSPSTGAIAGPPSRSGDGQKTQTGPTGSETSKPEAPSKPK